MPYVDSLANCIPENLGTGDEDRIEFSSVPDVDPVHPPAVDCKSGEYKQHSKRLKIFGEHYAQAESRDPRAESGSPEFRRLRLLEVHLAHTTPATRRAK